MPGAEYRPRGGGVISLQGVLFLALPANHIQHLRCKSFTNCGEFPERFIKGPQFLFEPIYPAAYKTGRQVFFVRFPMREQ